MLTPNEIQAMMERLAKATPGPYVADTDIYGAGCFVYTKDKQLASVNERLAGFTRDQAMDNAMFFAHARDDIPKLLLDREELQAEIERLKPLPPIDPRKPITVKDKYEPLQFHTLKEKDFIDGKLTDLKDFVWLVKELIKERNSMAETAWNSNVGYMKAQQELDSLRQDKERLDWLFLNWRQFELLRTTNTILYARQVIDAAIAQERKGEK